MIVTETRTTQYEVEQLTTSTGVKFWAAINADTGNIAFSSPRQVDADRYAAFRNQYVESNEVDTDWVSGSSTNWWARNGGAA